MALNSPFQPRTPTYAIAQSQIASAGLQIVPSSGTTSAAYNTYFVLNKSGANLFFTLTTDPAVLATIPAPGTPVDHLYILQGGGSLTFEGPPQAYFSGILDAASAGAMAFVSGGEGQAGGAALNASNVTFNGTIGTVNQGTPNLGGAAAWFVQSEDGRLASLGAKADVANTDSTSAWSVISLLKGIWAKLAATLTVSGAVTANQGGSWTVTANAGANLNTSALALESGGNLALIKAKTDNLDVAMSTRLKPADTLTAVTTLGTVTNPVGVKGGDGSTIASASNPFATLETAQLVQSKFDYIALSNYTTDNQPQTVVYKTGGSGGTTVATLTLAVSLGAAGGNLTSVTKT